MTLPPGEYPPPRPEDDNEPADSPASPWQSQRERDQQAHLWEDDQPSNRALAGDANEVWARDRAGGTGAGGSAAAPPGEATLAFSPATGLRANEDTPEDDEALAEAAVPTRPAAVRVRRVAWELVQTLVLAALIFLMVRGVAQNFRVEGPSMEPGLHNGQYLLVNKAVYFKLNLDKLSKYIPFIDGDGGSRFLFHGPERGDVVVFRYPRDPSRDFIKRIIGVPGDTVSISNGVVTVNGAVLEESYINHGANSDLEPKVVPEGSYFVMGDNRPNSSDSRNWGFVPEENIIGKAMFSYWPMSEFGGVGNTSIDLGFVKVPFF